MTTPLLLLVQHALPLHIQAIPHVGQHINDFVLPSSIDAAVYDDLQRVLNVFDGFCPYTVGAMDGAAANGRLDIVQRLQDERNEGCSSAAFIGAASNGHLEVLRWLYRFYPELRRGLQELTEATTHGHVNTVPFLLRRYRLEESESNRLFVIAAANGHVPVVRVFWQTASNVQEALAAAAGNGHAPVVRLLLKDAGLFANAALERALVGGHIGVIEILLKGLNNLGVRVVFRKIAAAIGVDKMRLILERCQVEECVLAAVLKIAAENSKADLVRVVLEKCPSMEITGRNLVWGSARFTNPIQSAVATAMIDAADAGRLDILRILTKESASYAGDTLCHAVANRQWEVQKLLLELCEEKYLREPRMASAITSMLEQAAAVDDLAVLQQIFTKCGEVDLGDALGTVNNAVEVVSLLVTKSEPTSVVAALYEAATKRSADTVQALLDHSDHQAIEKVLQKTIAAGDIEISTMLLSRCDPGAHKRIFQSAASSGCVGVLQLLLDQMEPCSIHRALNCAAARGHVKVVARLLEKSDPSAIACALELAAIDGQVRVVKLLRHRCDSAAIRNAVAIAKLVGYDEVVQLLSRKKARLA